VFVQTTSALYSGIPGNSRWSVIAKILKVGPFTCLGKHREGYALTLHSKTYLSESTRFFELPKHLSSFLTDRCGGKRFRR
jgi:hypothetical protein